MPPTAAARGDKPQSTLGVATLIGLRLLSPAVQYGVLVNGFGDPIIKAFNGTTLPSGPASILSLSLPRAILLGMSTFAAFKHIFQTTIINCQRMEPHFAIEQGLYNGVADTVCSLVFICAQTSPLAKGDLWTQVPRIVGLGLYAIGITLELGGEVQRYLFKQDPANEGKVYTGGFFGLSRHINYFGFTLWRTGYTIAATGWTLGAVSAVWATISFVTGSIPQLQRHLEQRYGEQYEQYKKAVPYAFAPFVY